MKILINAYACSPYQGSEPGMGWNFVKCLSEKHELHVITESKYEKEISDYLAKHTNECANCKFYYIKRDRHNLLRKIWPPSYYWFYKGWQKKALSLAYSLEQQEHFDLIHQLNMVGYREPGYLWKLDKPFVWGPISGFNITPWKLLYTMGLYGLVFYTCRNIINLWQMKTSRRVKNVVKRATAIMCATQEDSKAVSKLFHRDCSIVPEVGLTQNVNIELETKTRKFDEALKICWSGLHIPRKSLNLLLESLKGLDNIELHVLGDGPKRTSWERLAKDLGLTNVFWHGNVKRDDALRVMQECDVFVQTSLSDATSTVILEALSFGLPVIALDHLGFANIVTKDCGIKIPVNSKKQIVDNLSSAIWTLRDDNELLGRLSIGAKHRAQENSWENKAAVVNDIYEKSVKEFFKK